MAAFHLAWKQGADAVETDLRLTADGQLVAIHDAHGGRTLGDRRFIRDLSLAELRTLDAGRWKRSRWAGERVPALAEILAALPPGRQLVLELKEDAVDALARDLSRAPQDRITLIAFDAGIIARARQRLPQCRALWLFGDYGAIPPRDRGSYLARQVRELRVDGVDLRFERRLTPELLHPLQADGRTIYAYTPNDAAGVRRSAELGLHGIATDKPADARRWLGISA